MVLVAVSAISMFNVHAVFCLVYIFNGLLKEIEYEIYMFICAAAFVIVYCIVEYIAKPGNRKEIKLVSIG